MIVAVERGLENIKNYLENSGYNVVYADGYKGAIDAYVYKNAGISYVNSYNTFAQNSGNYSGVLIVNAKNKSLQDVEEILKNRVYGENINFI